MQCSFAVPYLNSSTIIKTVAKILHLYSRVRELVLTSLGTIAGCGTDPRRHSSVLSVDRWEVGAAAAHTPRRQTVDRTANAEGSTRVSVARSLAAVVDADHELTVEAAAPAGAALAVRNDGHRRNSLQ